MCRIRTLIQLPVVLIKWTRINSCDPPNILHSSADSFTPSDDLWMNGRLNVDGNMPWLVGEWLTGANSEYEDTSPNQFPSFTCVCLLVVKSILTEIPNQIGFLENISCVVCGVGLCMLCVCWFISCRRRPCHANNKRNPVQFIGIYGFPSQIGKYMCSPNDYPRRMASNDTQVTFNEACFLRRHSYFVLSQRRSTICYCFSCFKNRIIIHLVYHFFMEPSLWWKSLRLVIKKGPACT